MWFMTPQFTIDQAVSFGNLSLAWTIKGILEKEHRNPEYVDPAIPSRRRLHWDFVEKTRAARREKFVDRGWELDHEPNEEDAEFQKIHLEWRAQHAPQFALDFLPPYSPDLNPIERSGSARAGCASTIATSVSWRA